MTGVNEGEIKDREYMFRTKGKTGERRKDGMSEDKQERRKRGRIRGEARRG